MEEVLNNIKDNTYTENAPIAGADVVEWKPRICMKFETEEEAYDFYNSYAGRVGFSIRKEYFNKSKKTVDCCNFGDVVSFDITYKVVHGNHPFGSFLGLNHHREIIVFGVAFMHDETAESFVWLYQTFLKAMSGIVPQMIFTDQDAAMGKALTQEMPGTKHYLCVWHLMQNAQKHLGFLFRRAQSFKKVFSKLMFQIEEEEEFTREWNLMITEYGVIGNMWLTNLLGLKHRWAMAFIKRAWSTGIHSTQLSESFNGCLKAYLSRQLILPNFFTHFKRLLSDKRYKEYVAEYRLLHNLPQLKINCNILVEVANLYTKVIFNIFQEEFLAAGASQRIIGCSPIDGNEGCVYKVVGEDGMQHDVTSDRV
ncbi:protein FAR1-RELATED SEQUENCE 5-like [Cornus florida]|uniref:protein FAR1-RELATED SEQUENCE 5-like n=1 Tax=Cornus florida TaxID=4283 RepID=UPI00289BD015|nr:protein FAR1-RELATED SEQUENCE 5-like [Cornus florida]